MCVYVFKIICMHIEYYILKLNKLFSENENEKVYMETNKNTYKHIYNNILYINNLSKLLYVIFEY